LCATEVLSAIEALEEIEVQMRALCAALDEPIRRFAWRGATVVPRIPLSTGRRNEARLKSCGACEEKISETMLKFLQAAACGRRASESADDMLLSK
jgi:hypothetical protein